MFSVGNCETVNVVRAISSGGVRTIATFDATGLQYTPTHRESKTRQYILLICLKYRQEQHETK